MSSQKDKVISAMNPDSCGWSEWYSIPTLEDITGLKLIGNGSPLLQNDRGVGTVFCIEREYSGKRKKLEKVRLAGFKPKTNNNNLTVPPSIKSSFKGKSCVNCGTRSECVVDHKNGDKDPYRSLNESDYQILCKHCNTTKREACKSCKKIHIRYDATRLGFNAAFISGDENYKPASQGCIGCYWHDPIAFKKAFSLTKEDKED